MTGKPPPANTIYDPEDQLFAVDPNQQMSNQPYPTIRSTVFHKSFFFGVLVIKQHGTHTSEASQMFAWRSTLGTYYGGTRQRTNRVCVMRMCDQPL